MDFLELIHVTANDNIVDFMDLFRQNAPHWNERIFGNIFKRKFQCLARLAGIQKQLDYRRSIILEELEFKVREELNASLL